MRWMEKRGGLWPRVVVAAGVGLSMSASAMAMGGNNTTITAPALADFGRVLRHEEPSINVNLSKSGSNDTTYTATPNNGGLVVVPQDGDFNTGSGTKTEVLVFTLQDNAQGSASMSAKSFTVTIDNTAADSGGANQGSADPNDLISVTATIVRDRDLSSDTANLGRVMVGSPVSTSANVQGGSDDDNNATRVRINNGSAVSGGVTVARSAGSFTFNGASQTAAVLVSTTFATPGAKSGSVNVASLLANAETALTGTPTVDTSVPVNYTASALNNRDLTGDTAAIGRVMVNALGSANAQVSGGSADDDNATRVKLNNGSVVSGSVTATRSGGAFTFNGAGQSANVAVAASFTTTGVKSGNIEVASLLATGETAITGTPTVDSSVVLGYTATAVADRDIAQQGAPVNLGKVLVGLNTNATNGTLTGGSADDNNATRVGINAGSVSSGGVTATRVSGGDNTFDSASETKDLSLAGLFATSGNKSGAVNAAGLLTNAESAIQGAPTVDATVNLAWTAEVYQPVSLSATDSSGNLFLENAAVSDGGQRAAAKTTATSNLVGHTNWSVSGVISTGTVINAGQSITAAMASFDPVGLLNHPTQTYEADFSLEAQYADSDIVGGANSTPSWHLSAIVTGNVGDASAQIPSGMSYEGYQGVSQHAQGTVAEMLDGSAGDDRNIFMTWSPRTSETYGDIVDLTGTIGDTFVLQMTYDPSLYPGLESDIFLGWFDSGMWVNAVDGNIGGTPNFIAGAYNSSFFSLGNYGRDEVTNVVWAVINHNSEFAPLAEPEPAFEPGVAPEPNAAMLVILAGALMARRRRQVAGA